MGNTTLQAPVLYMAMGGKSQESLSPDHYHYVIGIVGGEGLYDGVQPATPVLDFHPGRGEGGLNARDWEGISLMTTDSTGIEVTDLTMAYGEKVVLHDLSFRVRAGDIFVIMGGSGCGKSTLLRHLIGLQAPFRGRICYEGRDLAEMDEEERNGLLRKMGVLYQGGALWSSMTLEENVALPLRYHTSLSSDMIRELAFFKLSLVKLGGFEHFYPSELSGGMRKRAALARAIALDPEYLFFDEPSAGLDPLTARKLDELILEIRDSLGATVIMVSHELASIFTVATNSVFLDSSTGTMLATGNPRDLLHESESGPLIDFLSRGTGKREVSLL